MPSNLKCFWWRGVWWRTSAPSYLERYPPAAWGPRLLLLLVIEGVSTCKIRAAHALYKRESQGQDTRLRLGGERHLCLAWRYMCV